MGGKKGICLYIFFLFLFFPSVPNSFFHYDWPFSWKTKADLPVDFFNPSVSLYYWKSLHRCGILWLWSLWLAAAVKRNKVFDKCFSDVPLCYCQIRFKSINALSNFERNKELSFCFPFLFFFYSLPFYSCSLRFWISEISAVEKSGKKVRDRWDFYFSSFFRHFS